MRRTQSIQSASRQRRKMDTGQVLLVMILLSVGFAFVLGLSVNSTPERKALAFEEASAVQPWKIASRVAGYAIWGIGAKVGAAVMAGYVVFYVIAIGRNWLDLHARQVHARDGLFPVIEIQRGVLYDPNRDNAGAHPLITLASLEVQKTAAMKADKILVRQVTKSLSQQADIPALEAETVSLPDMVRLADIAQHPTLDALVLGVGNAGVITASLYDLMHVLAVGASGYGKSALLRALMWQLAQVNDPVSIVGIDCFGSELNVIRDWEKLLFPVAKELPEATATLQAVTAEIARRKALYGDYPKAFDLPSYNRVSSKPLDPVVLLVDEGTAMLNEPGIADPLRQVVQTARQFGIYAMVAGQNVNHRVMPLQIRDNFSTRVCFHTSAASRHVVLGETPDDVRTKGRAWVMRPGEELQQIQCPFVTREEVGQVITVGKPARVLDVEAVKPVEVAEVRTIEDDPALTEPERVRLLDAQGVSRSEIERRVYGFTGGSAYRKVKEILSE